jgi:hypothetical protein
MYASVSDIRNFLPQLQINAQSRPTESEVVELIESYSEELDGVLKSLGYTVPMTDVLSPMSVRLAKQMIKERVSADVLRIQLAGIRDADSLGAKAFESSWNAKMKRLADPDDPFTFPDAVATERQEKMDVTAASMVSEDPDFYDDAVITRNQVF